MDTSLNNHPRRRVFHKVNLGNLDIVLQRNLRISRAKECLFRASGGANFAYVDSMYVRVCSKKLWMCHCIMLTVINKVVVTYNQQHYFHKVEKKLVQACNFTIKAVKEAKSTEFLNDSQQNCKQRNIIIRAWVPGQFTYNQQLHSNKN